MKDGVLILFIMFMKGKTDGRGRSNPLHRVYEEENGRGMALQILFIEVMKTRMTQASLV
jgi:hypothetical protein